MKTRNREYEYLARYYLKDQVGNVRVILLRGTTAGIPPLAFQNYYPFGMKQPGGLSSSHTQRFGYQGEYAEKDPETGLAAFEARMYDAVTGRWLAVDPQHQYHSPYLAMGNNPVMMVDPDGEFVTWNIGKGGLSIGFNFTPIGVPFGIGVNVGWVDGGSVGVYGEVGFRVGGTGFGSGVTMSKSLDYGFRSRNFSSTESVSAYASYAAFNVSGNISTTYDKRSEEPIFNWSVGVGINLGGNDRAGIGLSLVYSSDGFSYGLGGYYNPHAWDSNPSYSPDDWNDDGEIQYSNNCYSYALDEIDNGNRHGRGMQPGVEGGQPITTSDDLNLDRVTSAALSDGRIKKPTFWNKLGFGKRGYYSAYLVISEGYDYHWYRQDKGGKWSHKPGYTRVTNVDAGQPPQLIRDPVRANHGIYNNGGILLWIKR